MLPKIKRADKKSIERVFKEGKTLNSPSFSIRFIKTEAKMPARISVIVPKAVSSKATARNNLRRIGYKAISNHIDLLPEGLVAAILFKKDYQTKSIESETEILFNKLN